jgi:hypothetical protein
MQHDPHRPEDVLKVDCDEDGVGGDDARIVAGAVAKGADGDAEEVEGVRWG